MRYSFTTQKISQKEKHKIIIFATDRLKLVVYLVKGTYRKKNVF